MFKRGFKKNILKQDKDNSRSYFLKARSIYIEKKINYLMVKTTNFLKIFKLR
jgi:hypothetical protein